MPDFLGPDGEYRATPDGQHIIISMRWKDADGVTHVIERVTPFSSFLIWHERAERIIAEVMRKRAEAEIIEFPERRRHAADSV